MQQAADPMINAVPALLMHWLGLVSCLRLCGIPELLRCILAQLGRSV